MAEPVSRNLPLPDKPSIAVLPLVNMSSDPGQDHIADRVVEEIIAALSCPLLPSLSLGARQRDATSRVTCIAWLHPRFTGERRQAICARQRSGLRRALLPVSRTTGVCLELVNTRPAAVLLVHQVWDERAGPGPRHLWPAGPLGKPGLAQHSLDLSERRSTVVRRSARRFGFFKGLASRLKHCRAARVAFPPAHRDIDVFWLNQQLGRDGRSSPPPMTALTRTGWIGSRCSA